jgi:hypothetical protein
MRRARLIGLVVTGGLILVLAGYTAFWFIAAARLEDGIGRLAAALRPHKIDLSWQRLRVGGFPLTLRLDLAHAELRDRVPVAASVTRLPRLSASAAPWNFSAWHLVAPDGVQISAGDGRAPLAALAARAATGGLLILPAGGLNGWVEFDEPQADARATLAAQKAELRLSLPARPPKRDDDPALGFAIDAQTVTLPSLPAPLRNPLDELAFAVTLRGPVPTTPPRQAATAWRDAGGTADIDRFTLRSGALTIAGSGTVALDADLQPEGAFSLAVEDYPGLLKALVAAGRLRRRGAELAGLALSLLAKPGPDGKPEIKTPLRMQRGELFLGPLAIGPAPHIDW